MLTDSFFKIGKHDVCEDYATHGPNYAIVSDGCSSGIKTDWGARLYTQLAAKYIDMGLDPINLSFYHGLNVDVESLIGSLHLSPECTLASLGIIYEYNVHLFGDGHIVLLNKDGTIDWTEIVYDNNSPFYPRYLKYNGKAAYFDWEWYKRKVYYRKINLQDGKILDYDVSLVNDKESGLYTEFADSDSLASFIFTDGLSSFNKNCLSLLQELLQVKIKTSSFLQRRCKSFFKMYCTNNDISHYDDFAVGAIIYE